MSQPLTQRTSLGRPIVAQEKSDVSKANFFSHDWTDPTTWYGSSVRVVEEVATDSGAHTVYDLENANVIDTYHGKLFAEDYLKDANGNSFRVVVTVNDVPKTERDPHLGSGGDFSLDYASGAVTFFSALGENDVVKATYHYATDSTFTIKPLQGKSLSINFAEVQFSSDVELNDSVRFQPYGLVEVFAPQLLPGVPEGTLIPLGDPLVYKTIRDFQAEAVKAFPTYPAMGGSSWRGIQTGMVIMDWDYVSSTLLRSDYGMEVRLKLEHDVPFGGTYASATFYCTSESL